MKGKVTQLERIAWSLEEVSKKTGLSLGFLRNDVKATRLRVRKFGRRVLVLDNDLRQYLNAGSAPGKDLKDGA